LRFRVLFLCTVYKPNSSLTSFLFLPRSFKTVLRFPVGLAGLCRLVGALALGRSVAIATLQALGARGGSAQDSGQSIAIDSGQFTMSL
jgi:hypothetical protein